MPKTDSIIGKRFGRLIVVSQFKKNGDKPRLNCVCDCGNEITVLRYNVLSGNSKSCGCVAKRKVAERRRTHGDSGSPEHEAWKHIIGRCTNPKNNRYKTYGARGITVDESFRGPSGYANFLACVGRKPSDKHSINRINNDGNYEPGNLSWSDHITQANNKSNNVLIEYQGRVLTETQWAIKLGFRKNVIRRRLIRGWTVNDAITTPAGQKRKKVTA